MKPGRIETLLRCAVIACALGVGAAACADREHVRDDYGKSTRAFQAKQRVFAQAATGTPTGLDSEESAVIHKRYTSGLGGSARGTRDESRVLILGEAPNAGSK